MPQRLQFANRADSRCEGMAVADKRSSCGCANSTKGERAGGGEGGKDPPQKEESITPGRQFLIAADSPKLSLANCERRRDRCSIHLPSVGEVQA
jgi:hypothetical protein